MVNVFVTGTFDLLHPGHIYLLNECKKLAGKDGLVIVAVSPDKLGPKYKRERILSQSQRMFMIDNLEGPFVAIGELNKDPPKNIESRLKWYKPDVFVCTPDNPFYSEYFNLCKELGIMWCEIQRNMKGIYDISTTKILERIKND